MRKGVIIASILAVSGLSLFLVLLWPVIYRAPDPEVLWSVSQWNYRQQPLRYSKSILTSLNSLKTPDKLEGVLDIPALELAGDQFLISSKEDLARKSYEHAISLRQTYGQTNNENLACDYLGLASCAVSELIEGRGRNQAADAARQMEKALAKSREVCGPKSPAAFFCLLKFAHLRFKTGNFAESNQLLEQALALAKEAGNDKEEDSALSALLDLSQAQGHKSQQAALVKQLTLAAKDEYQWCRVMRQAIQAGDKDLSARAFEKCLEAQCHANTKIWPGAGEPVIGLEEYLEYLEASGRKNMIPQLIAHTCSLILERFPRDDTDKFLLIATAGHQLRESGRAQAAGLFFQRLPGAKWVPGDDQVSRGKLRQLLLALDYLCAYSLEDGNLDAAAAYASSACQLLNKHGDSLSFSDEDPRPSFTIAQVSYFRKDYSRAAAVLESFLSGEEARLYAQAKAAANEAAGRLTDGSLESRIVRGYRLLSIVESAAGHAEMSKQCLSKASGLPAVDESDLLSIANTAIRLGFPDVAVACARKANAQFEQPMFDITNFTERLGLLRSLDAQGKKAESQILSLRLEKALQQDKSCPSDLLPTLLTYAGKIKGAAPAWQKWRQSNSYSSGNVAYGDFLAASGKGKEAALVYRQALSRCMPPGDEEDAKLCRKLAALCRKSSNPAEAARLEKAAKFFDVQFFPSELMSAYLQYNEDRD